MISLISYIDDYPCPDPTFGPEEGETLAEFLTADVASYFGEDDVATLYIESEGFDGIDHRVPSGLFTFTGDISLQRYDACITGSEQHAASDGYWMFIEPLPPGVWHVMPESHSPVFGAYDMGWKLTVE